MAFHQVSEEVVCQLIKSDSGFFMYHHYFWSTIVFFQIMNLFSKFASDYFKKALNKIEVYLHS